MALKVLPARSRGPGSPRRFEQEARAPRPLNHPNILAVHDVGQPTDTPTSCRSCSKARRCASACSAARSAPRRVVDFATQVARRLAAAHGKGIVHRDLKPDNLFITRDGRVKVLDFGIAKLVQRKGQGLDQFATGPNTQSGTVVGTVAYMSPEQAAGAG